MYYNIVLLIRKIIISLYQTNFSLKKPMNIKNSSSNLVKEDFD